MIFDLIIIGGGPAGYRAAEQAARNKLCTALFEQENLGGVCLNEGCIPTKTLLYSAKLYEHAAKSERYGVTSENAAVALPEVIKRKDRVVKTLVAGVKAALKSEYITIISSRAAVNGRDGELFAVEAGGERYLAKKLLLCCGSRTIIPPVKGAEGDKVITSREALSLDALPRSLVIVGGGVIGLEFASFFNSCGSSVTVVEMLDHIAGESDRELSRLLMANLEKRGVRFMLSSRVTEINDMGAVVETDGASETIPADRVLLSVGRRANTDGLGLETIGVELARGAVVTDSRMRTNVSGVYAAGDINGKSMLAHTAYREADVAINDLCLIPDCMSYDAIPSVVYTNPELAYVGATEKGALEKGVDAKRVTMPMRFSGRYLAENDGGNGVFTLVVDSCSHRVIGGGGVGNGVSEFICALGACIEAEMTVEQVKRIVFPHPTVSEIIRDAAFAADE